jgi:hypothetical protein
MIAGTLEVQMAANLARLADDMGKAKSMVGSSMKSIEGAVASAKSALGALGIGFGVGYFVTLIKGSIDAADKLKDLGKSTNIPVTELAGLRLLARQTGTELDGLAKGINKMSVEMGKDPAKFAALGITAKDNIGALKQFADLFNTLPDINQRNAIAQAVFGKSWAELAPALSEGGKKIGEIIARGTELSGTTKQMTDDADELNDKWEELVGTGGLVNSMVAKMLGPLLSLTNQMIAARDASSGFLDALARFFTIGGDQAADPATAIAKIDEKLIALHKTSEELASMGWLQRWFSADDIAIVKTQIAFLEKQRETLAALAAMPKNEPTGGVDPAAAAAAARGKAFLGDEDKEGMRLIRSLKDELAGFDQQATTVDRVMRKLTDGTHNYTQANQDAALAIAAEIDLRKQAKIELDAYLASNEINLALEQEVADVQARQQDQLNAAVEAITVQNMTEKELLQLHLDEKLALLDQARATDLISEQLYEEQRYLLTVQAQARFGDATAQGAIARRNFEQMTARQQTQFVMGELAGLTAGVAQHNRFLFNVNKVAGIGTAVMNAYIGISRTLGAYPFPWNIAMAALHGVAAFAQVNAIRSAQFGAGTSAPSIGGGNAIPVTPASGTPEFPVASPVLPQAAAPRTRIDVTVIDPEKSMTYKKFVEEIVPLWNESLANGADIHLTLA